MNTHISFPENITDFLTWVKTTTELAWSNAPIDSYFHGAKWLPLNDGEIDDLEKKYRIQFGEEHRAFLKVLHTINRKNPTYDGWKDQEDDNEVKQMGHPSYFYNWFEDTQWIESRLSWPYDTILQDIFGLNKRWLKIWGPCPDSTEEKIRVFTEWYNKAPRLIPLFAHRFLMGNGHSGLKPVLSVWGSDIVIIAWSLRHFLMRNFARELDLEVLVWDEEDGCFGGFMKEGIPELDALETIRTADAVIPYWKEVITSISPIWPGFRVKE
ncbi:hypothetical protein [Niastella sp. OAS944]|uniref:hypothetical protein n=1 Tax=Niastella sp. OAS944 TaxID=2664089 RepID=UPI00348B10E0|nr:hypothetical protein [Chitinophagaceae bacterium OAS944]